MSMPGRSRPLFLLAPALVLAFYGPALHRYFTSEDFLLVRVLGASPPWRDPDAWTGPWLGITVVKFYRPVSTLLYALEIAAFGISPLGYNLVHTLIHVANAVLVYAIVRRLVLSDTESLDGRLVAGAAATLFALHPLHPNAVLFGSSFATLWGSAFVLGSFLAYQEFRAAGGRHRLALSLVLFVLALGSYETAATLPLLLLAHDWSFRRPGGRLASLPFFAVLGGYFLLRRAIFGVFVGGYDDASARLVHPDWRLWLADLATSVQKLHAPSFELAPSPWAPPVALALACVAPLAFLALSRRRAGPAHARLWLFAWAWIVIGMSPFAFRPVVPANGRYWYLAAAGAAMAAAFLARAVAAALTRGRVLPWAALTVLAACWAWLLAGNLGVYVAAGRTAQTIQRQLVREHAVAGAPERTFVTRYPYFLYTGGGAPAAQVFHYGLRDAVNPPFVSARVPVYPLPPLRGAALYPIFMADPRAVVFEWDGGFRRVEAGALGETPPEVEVLAPPDGAVLDRGALHVRLVPGRFDAVRLIVSAPGNGNADTVPLVAGRDGTATIAMPTEFVTAMARLYPDGEFCWWVEARTAGGRVVAISRMRTFRFLQSGSRSS